MRRVLAFALLLVSACAHARPVLPPPPPPRAELREAAGLSFAVVPLETEGLVRVAVYVAAGARDADVPGTATVAALLAAEATSDATRAFVTTDTTELATVVEADALDRALEASIEGLAPRRPTDEAFERALDALRSRRIAAARDSLRAAELGAVQALVGLPTEALDPLGRPEDPLPDADDVRSLLEARYVRQHLRVVITGDVDEREAAAAIERLATRVASGAGPAEPSRDRAEARSASAELGSREIATLAILLPGEPRGSRFAERLRALVGPPDHGRFAFSSLPTRDGLVVLAQAADVEDPFAELERLANAAAIAGASPRTGSPAPPDAIAAARELGLGLGSDTRGDARHSAHVVTRGPRTRPTSDRAPEAVLEAATERVASALARGLAEARPQVGGAIDETHADARIGRGAIVRVRRAARARSVGLAIRFHAPDLVDERAAHGTKAVLARALSRACSSTLELEPFADAEGFGVTARGTPDEWLEAAHAFLPCVLGHELGETAYDEAIRDVLAELRRAPFADDLADLARALSPELASSLAPLGSRAGLGRLDTTSLRLALHAARTAEHVRVAVVGDVEPRAVVEGLGPHLGSLHEGEGLEPARALELPELVAAQTAAPFPLVLVVARTEARPALPALGRGLATRVSTLLAGLGAEVLESRGDARGDEAIAAVLVRVDEAALERMPEALARGLADAGALETTTHATVDADRLAMADPAAAARADARSGTDRTSRPGAPGAISLSLVVGRDQPLGGAAVGREAEPAEEDPDAR
ncbi:MAG: hypothetical protein U0230_14755 [Polyangiales bacterium]